MARDPQCFNSMLNFVDALKQYKSRLSEYEQTEILDYPEVWFLGLNANKIQTRQGSAHNSGYDDESGSYLKVCISRFILGNVSSPL